MTLLLDALGAGVAASVMMAAVALPKGRYAQVLALLMLAFAASVAMLRLVLITAQER